jgi:DNA-binding MarR family transcriptional regulator
MTGQARAAAETTSQAVLTVLRLFRALERVDAGLTPQQYRVLRLAGAGGERSARLAELLAVAKPTITATADGLVAAGFARRDAEPGDRRVVRLCLTEGGHVAVERADAAYAGWLERLLAATGDPEGTLCALTALDGALDELRRGRRPAPAPAPARAAARDQVERVVMTVKTAQSPEPAHPAQRPASAGLT